MADSDSDAEKTLAPSAKRLQDAREEGQVPRSRELATLFMVGGACTYLIYGGGYVLDGIQAMMRHALVFDDMAARDPQLMATRLGSLMLEGFLAVAPLLAIGLGGGVLGMLALGGWNLTAKALQVRPERLSPLQGIKRMFSLHTLGELGKAILAVLFVGGLAILYLYNHMDGFFRLSGIEARTAVFAAGAETVGLLGLLIMPLVVIGGVDAALAWWKHYRELRMTVEEAKREAKETEGNPEIKSRIRQQQREMARKRMMAAVPTADVVVTNPTHYAVALAYREGAGKAPRVVAKGVDLTAARIRGLAVEHKVMMVEAPPLARALYKHVDLEAEIPASLYAAVAQVLAYVFQIRAGAVNVSLGDVALPPGLDPLEISAQESPLTG